MSFKTIDEQIEQELRELALTDVKKLLEYIDVKKYKICRQRKMGKSLQQIANAMQMPRPSVQTICDKC